MQLLPTPLTCACELCCFRCTCQATHTLRIPEAVPEVLPQRVYQVPTRRLLHYEGRAGNLPHRSHLLYLPALDLILAVPVERDSPDGVASLLTIAFLSSNGIRTGKVARAGEYSIVF